MTKPKRTVPKTRKEVRNYVKQISKLDYAPTVDDLMHFPASDDPARATEVDESPEPETESTVRRLRRVGADEKLKDHFQKNWLTWIVTILAAGLTYFALDAKIDISKLGVSLGSLKESVEKIDKNSTMVQERMQKQELEIHKSDWRFQTLEKSFEKILNSLDAIKKSVWDSQQKPEMRNGKKANEGKTKEVPRK